MSGTVAILGANGVYGRHLTPRLVAAGYSVRALVRRPDAAGVARACGAEVAIADIFDADTLSGGLDGCEVCINLATSLPGPSGRGDYDVNDRVRREGVPQLIEAAPRARPSPTRPRSTDPTTTTSRPAPFGPLWIWKPPSAPRNSIG
jgi:uncharacterized protein YbjT (DUF2867 family)